MKTISIIVWLLVLPLSLFAKEIQREKSKIKCTYRHTTKPFIGDTLKVTEEFVLISSDKVSMYLSAKAFNISQKANELFSQKTSELFISSFQSGGRILNQMPKTKINNYKVYKFSDSRKVITLTSDFITPFQLEESMDDFDWIITNEMKEILGYQCIKATLGFGVYHLEVWFAPEIPISDGPFVFCGLPGLILKIQDTEKRHSFELLTIEKDGDIEFTIAHPEDVFKGKITKG
ncbi:GLPGLI family protein [Flammeovirga aprica]|uniref:GLPGLI family protein n=1 Tax=Flammeovirga aprica JL-4 TaxID=694437 RepID=A0A7X9P070_9BACT|nr:GLPGLI family protein [Flammeovirga aprica]NME67134.1 GLPGLI family protein [Flammeovirga aprica JL-4]